MTSHLLSLSTTSAHLFTALFASLYVGSLYLSKHARLVFTSSSRASVQTPRNKEPDERWRDDPDVIRARLSAASLATVACCAVVYGVVWVTTPDGEHRNYNAGWSTLTRLGINPPALSQPVLETILPHLVTPLLFLGPLYARFLLHAFPFQKYWSWREAFGIFTTWQGIRNYIVAPLTEEITFRACVLAIYSLSGASRTRIIFLSPLSFGAAHIHHAWDTYNRHGRTASAAKRAVLATLFQTAYTTLFGAHAAFLFLRTSSLLPPLSAHVFCNLMGVPSPSWEIQRVPRQKYVILTAYFLGMVGFAFALGPWTRTDGLYWRR
jgi:prenyl protein peptidase